MAVSRPRRRVVVLGSTGSIGRQALDVIRSHPGSFRVVGLASGRYTQLFAEQVKEFGPDVAGVALIPRGGAHPGDASRGFRSTVRTGPDASLDVVREAGADLVLNAVPGFRGLVPALAALEQGSIVAMAAKEALVAGVHLLKQAAAAGGGQLVPVDGEPRAVLQCLSGPGARDSLRCVYLTASGGPFWGRPRAELEQATPDEALRHPRWSMGPKISVDSATMFNKGLEVIEIARLFDLAMEQIEIVVQPESAVHSLVEFSDGSILAQLGPTDMRVAISQALFHPALAPEPPARLDLDGLCLHFQRPVPGDWPCLDVALEAGGRGGTLPAVVGAADEVLVQAFLEGRIGLGCIGRGLGAVLAAHAPLAQDSGPYPALHQLIEADAWARTYTRRWCASGAGAAASEPERQPEGGV